MGAVLVMLLALVLPVAQSSAENDGPDQGTVTAAAVGVTLINADCTQQLPNLQARYFVTLVDVNNVPVTNASVLLVGAGTTNLNQSVTLAVGNLESQANPGADLNNNGVCPEAGIDAVPATNDSLSNDYGSPAVCSAVTTCTWDLYVTAPLMQPVVLTDTRALVDQTALPVTFLGQQVGGTGCTKTTAGCIVSLGTLTLQSSGIGPVPNAGRGSISGNVTDVFGRAAAGIEVVIFRQPDQDPTNDLAGPIAENTAFSVLTDASGNYFIGNLAPGNYTVTVADTRFPEPCPPSASCGIQPATAQVALGVVSTSGGAIASQVCQNFQVTNVVATPTFTPFPSATPVVTPSASPTNTAIPTATPVTASCGTNTPNVPPPAKVAPGQTVGASQVGVFGYLVDGSSGARVGGLNPGIPGFQPGNITFTPAGGSGAASVTATTDQTGLYQAILVAGVTYTASVVLPPGYVGACTAGGNSSASNITNANPSTTPLFACLTGVNGTDRFVFPATASGGVPAIASPVAGLWNDGATFVLVPSQSTLQNTPGQSVPRRLEAVVPGIYRNPDTAYTGVDVETVQVRVVNNGTLRTVAQIEWWSTSSDDIASLVKTDYLDLNSGAVGIFTRSVVPDGCTRCMAQIFSFDQDAVNLIGLPTGAPVPFNSIPGLSYGLSDLQATVTHWVVDAGNALAGSNAMSFEDLFPTGNNINTNYVLPIVYKNYGGGVNKWNSIISGCLTRGVPAPQPVVFTFGASGDTRGGPYNITRLTNPGGCLVLNLSTFDPNNPDYYDPLGDLPDGTYSVTVSTTAGLPVPVAPERPGGFFAHALSYTTTGRMAILNNGAPPAGLESPLPCQTTNQGFLNPGTGSPFTPGCSGNNAIGGREMYGPLLFKRYNDWNSGIAIANYRCGLGVSFLACGNASGGSTSYSMAFYGEDATLFGVFLDRASNEQARIYYLPTLPIQIPDGYRGTSIITAGDVGGSSHFGATAIQVNYERNQAMSYNFMRQDALTAPQAQNVRPCNQLPAASFLFPQVQIAPTVQLPPGSSLVSCLVVPDAERRFGAPPRGSAATFEVGMGPTTGIRLFNPGRDQNGGLTSAPAFVVAQYQDSAGQVFTDSYTTFTIPTFGTGTIFMGADARLPDIYDGTMFIQSTTPLVGIANVVDYRATDHDGSFAFNLPNQSGMTQ